MTSWCEKEDEEIVHTLRIMDRPLDVRGSRRPTIDNSRSDLEKHYDVDRQASVGQGVSAAVYRGRERATGTTHAVKCIAKEFVQRVSDLQNEIKMMLALDHPNIVRLFQVFEDRQFIYLILELCAGGELFERIYREGKFSERVSALVMEQVFRAVHYMHLLGYCHRDLKPENVLLQRQEPIEGNTLKVIDFGLSAAFVPERPLRTKVGTPYYVAPEVIRVGAKYGPECDMWSCGVIMYVLHSGLLPFKGANEKETLVKVASGIFTFPPREFEHVSKDAKSLIRRLLVKDQAKRCTAEQALQDKWVRETAPSAKSVPLPATMVNHISTYNAKQKLQKVALNLAARHSSSSQLSGLSELFKQLDADGSGSITKQELAKGLESAGLSPEHVQSIMEGLDANCDGLIDYTEFLAGTMERRQLLEESACWAAFRAFDRNGDGKVDAKELREVLSSPFLKEAWDQKVLDDFMQSFDTNGDGFIDYQEFKSMMRK